MELDDQAIQNIDNLLANCKNKNTEEKLKWGAKEFEAAIKENLQLLKVKLEEIKKSKLNKVSGDKKDIDFDIVEINDIENDKDKDITLKFINLEYIDKFKVMAANSNDQSIANTNPIQVGIENGELELKCKYSDLSDARKLKSDNAYKLKLGKIQGLLANWVKADVTKAKKLVIIKKLFELCPDVEMSDKLKNDVLGVNTRYLVPLDEMLNLVLIYSASDEKDQAFDYYNNLHASNLMDGIQNAQQKSTSSNLLIKCISAILGAVISVLAARLCLGSNLTLSQEAAIAITGGAIGLISACVIEKMHDGGRNQ